MKYIGAHINRNTTIVKTIKDISDNGGNALQIFVSNPRDSKFPDIEKYIKEKDQILTYCTNNNFKLIVHGSYTINLANDKINKRITDINDRYWIELLIKELEVCELLNATGVVIHVGKHTTNTYDKGLENMFDSIKYIINHLQVKYENKFNSKLIIETPAGVGTELIKDVDEFLNFYNKFTLKDKKNLGICLDTAHIWSSGYNINDYYNKIIKNNSKDIVVIHYNNSKLEKGSLVDRHECIFDGKIKIEDMKKFITNLELNPMIILEKPSNLLNKELDWIKAL
jgi:deoxyribonuclease IV